MSPYGCPCQATEALCDRCLDEQLSQLAGAAQARGHDWCGSLLNVIPVSKPWPATTERMRAIARRKVSDLTRDARLRELLAGEVICGAERRWNRVWLVRSDRFG